MKHRTSQRHNLGFTLIEIVVAVAILAVLSSIVAVKVIGNVETASIAKAKTDVQSLSGALNMYKL
ncbi:MAG: prepilin-type N-terminal cleavage/methylation domain-containing protein, partial [Lysobacterales bacterium]